jgi:hypothetical protein
VPPSCIHRLQQAAPKGDVTTRVHPRLRAPQIANAAPQHTCSSSAAAPLPPGALPWCSAWPPRPRLSPMSRRWPCPRPQGRVGLRRVAQAAACTPAKRHTPLSPPGRLPASRLRSARIQSACRPGPAAPGTASSAAPLAAAAGVCPRPAGRRRCTAGRRPRRLGWTTRRSARRATCAPRRTAPRRSVRRPPARHPFDARPRAHTRAHPNNHNPPAHSRVFPPAAPAP